MTITSTHPGLTPQNSGEPAPQVVRVPPELRLAAASRLVAHQAGDPTEAGARFLESADQLRIDLNLMWCVLDAPTPEDAYGTPVRQACLAVIGSGRTAMLFLSGTDRRARAWTGATRFRAQAALAVVQAERDRVALLRGVCAELGSPSDGSAPKAVLAQALLETRETAAAQALTGAGFIRLGDLLYMRRPLSRTPGRAVDQAGAAEWPAGVRVRSLADLHTDGHSNEQIRTWLLASLASSYIETRDCPELCGMRSMDDVLESHESVGEFDPSLWWIVFEGDTPAGCMLLTVCPDHDSVELVYLGLAPSVRGKGLGASLLAFGIRRLYDAALASQPVPGHPHIGGTGGLTCAVDARNTPAVRLYKHAGFERFGVRVPFVRSLTPVGP